MTEYAQRGTPAVRNLRVRAQCGLLLIFSAGLAAAGLVLAQHYPLTPVVPAGLFLAVCAFSFLWPTRWLLALLAALPLVGFAPWTGWITFEEWDMLVLATGAGGYANIAWRRWGNAGVRRRRGSGQPMNALPWLLAGLFIASIVTAMFRGFADAGGFVFGWFQGYQEPMNSVRLAKSFLGALLLTPIYLASFKENQDRAQSVVAGGMTIGLLVAGVATIWERAAFVGLLDFSSDYRTTGPFWEMHVGGAALDGFLALTVPFAVWNMLVARNSWRWGTSAAVLAVAIYACLTTFSRGVYVAVPLGAAVLLALYMRQRGSPVTTPGAPSAKPQAGKPSFVVAALMTIAGFGVGAAWLFPTSGYRGVGALLVDVFLMVPLIGILRRFKFSQWLVSVVVGLGVLIVVVAIDWALPKGAYLAWGVSVLLAIVMTVRASKVSSVFSGVLAFCGFIGALAGTALVALHWGESPGLVHAVPVLLILLAVCIAASFFSWPVWPVTVREHAVTVIGMGVVAAFVGIFGGGAYMGSRFSTGEQDLDVRLNHWQLGRDMIRTESDWIFGKGLGRFPANYLLVGNPEGHPGDYRLRQEVNNNYLALTSGLHMIGWGEMFRVTQRIGEPGGDTVVKARVRVAKDISLHFEICEKHLLYTAGCSTKQTLIKGIPDVWQPVSVVLPGSGISRGLWYAPRLIAFSVAIESHGGAADLDDLSLTRPDGSELLANGDFTGGMAHWFFSSDRNHLPWHIKNIVFNVLFDQGLLGLTIWSLLVVGALWRTALGGLRQHPLAPALAASIAGFLVVGLFDSLLDVPRVSWLFYLLLLLAVMLPGRRSLRTGSPGYPPPQRAALLLLICMAGWLCSGVEDVRAEEKAPNRQVISVGPARSVKTLSDASKLARNGALVEVDAGDYAADVAVWTQDDLTLRAVGGRVRLLAAGAAAEGKAIWVLRGGRVLVEGFDFVGARVPDRNGAGIRFEKGKLKIRNCSFIDNENGILASNQPDAELEIENSEFGRNGFGDGQSHNLYVGAIARLSVTGSYFHHANVGHLLKSRAAANYIYYNRLTDENDGHASYELELANGGLAYVVGNIIQQSAQTENPLLISYGTEGYKWPTNGIYLVNNTLVDDRPQGGVFLRITRGDVAVKAINNLLVGPGRLESSGPGDYRNNVNVGRGELEATGARSYGLKRDSRLLGKAIEPGSVNGVDLQPRAEYVYPTGTRAIIGKSLNPGALQSPSSSAVL